VRPPSQTARATVLAEVRSGDAGLRRHGTARRERVYQIGLTATDSLGASAQAYLDIEVLDVNPPLAGQDAGDILVGTVYPS